MAKLKKIGESKNFGGWTRVFQHDSKSCSCIMKFSVFLPPQINDDPVPVLTWLSGLTCTHENFITKAGAQKFAAEHGLMLVAPDTSPRGVGIQGEDDSYDLGTGAGFYVNATQENGLSTTKCTITLLRSYPLWLLINLMYYQINKESLGIAWEVMGL